MLNKQLEKLGLLSAEQGLSLFHTYKNAAGNYPGGVFLSA